MNELPKDLTIPIELVHKALKELEKSHKCELVTSDSRNLTTVGVKFFP
jgi:hypothetical protein